MQLAIFDLDQTIIDKDSDHCWNVFISQKGYQNLDEHLAINDYFYQAYLNGTLVIKEYLDFNLKFFSQHSMDKINSLLNEFVEQEIRNEIRPKAIAKINEHKNLGHTILIITATNVIVTTPIAKMLNINNLIATNAEIKNGEYTGKSSGIPSFAGGKVTRLNEWLAVKNLKLTDCESYFYSDSFNDRFLLDLVNYPVAVNPDAKLKTHANQKGWQIVDWRIDKNN